MSSIDSGLGSAGNVGPADERPLTQQEYQLLQRLLSDPFSLPTQFKTWLVSYLETSDINLPMSAINGLTAMLGITGVGGGTLGILPAGLIFPFGGVSAPTGSKMCDGAVYSQTTEQRLYTAIGGRYNIGGEAAGTFRVPDIRERIPVGLGAIAEHNTLGKTENSAYGQRGTKHNSTKSGTVSKTGTVVLNDPGHVHRQNGYGGGVTTGGAGPQGAADSTVEGNTDPAGTGITLSDTIGISDGISVGPGGTRPVDTPAFITLNFIIVS